MKNMKRPALSESSFLGHIFSPKKHALPTGLRKTTLKGARGTSKRRVAAYNKMSPVNQEILKRTGKRDAYLKGEGTLADAKRELRKVAVQLGIAKPTRTKLPALGTRTALDEFVRRQIASNIIKQTRDADKNPNTDTVYQQIEYLDSPDKSMVGWDYGHIKYAGRPGSEYETYVDGRLHNPFWYH